MSPASGAEDAVRPPTGALGDDVSVNGPALLHGRAWVFGDDISTDHIAPGRLFHLRTNLPELAKHVMEDADPSFAASVRPGDIIVGGRNFGLGSSREHAPRIIKLAGVGAVLAQSFARIFFRNAINVGLPALQCDTAGIKAGDELQVDLAAGEVRNLTSGSVIAFVSLPPVMVTILSDGGLVAHMQKHGGFALPGTGACDGGCRPAPAGTVEDTTSRSCGR
jgi:3-isopropylmalate/(R)-2-methylmalate dehydratase small subunit